jgi:hypothetical protein
VYGVFECKPTLNKDYIEYAEKKAASVRGVHRTSVAIAYAGGTCQPKPHFRILAGILAPSSSWAHGLGEALERNLSSDPDNMLDCGVAIDCGCFDRYEEGLSITNEQGALMYFLFRLLARLQSLGTVPAIHWTAYSRVN